MRKLKLGLFIQIDLLLVWAISLITPNTYQLQFNNNIHKLKVTSKTIEKNDSIISLNKKIISFYFSTNLNIFVCNFFLLFVLSQRFLKQYSPNFFFNWIKIIKINREEIVLKGISFYQNYYWSAFLNVW